MSCNECNSMDCATCSNVPQPLTLRDFKPIQVVWGAATYKAYFGGEVVYLRMSPNGKFAYSVRGVWAVGRSSISHTIIAINTALLND